MIRATLEAETPLVVLLNQYNNILKSNPEVQINSTGDEIIQLPIKDLLLEMYPYVCPTEGNHIAGGINPHALGLLQDLLQEVSIFGMINISDEEAHTLTNLSIKAGGLFDKVGLL